MANRPNKQQFEPHRWYAASNYDPPFEGRYICALKASKSKDPRISFEFWTKDLRWSSKYVTHWMLLPENPND